VPALAVRVHARPGHHPVRLHPRLPRLPLTVMKVVKVVKKDQHVPASAHPAAAAPAGPAHGSTLHLDLPPTIGIAPGAVWCGLAIRIGRSAPDASTVGRAAAVGDRIGQVGPAADRVWLQAVDARIGMLMRRHDAAARADLAYRGITVPSDASPFYVALAQVPLPEAWGDLAPGAKATRPCPASWPGTWPRPARCTRRCCWPTRAPWSPDRSPSLR
jgi:hypothetical protein